MKIIKSKTPRRRELRRSLQTTGITWRQLATGREIRTSAIILAAFTFLSALMALAAQNRLRYQEGQVTAHPVFARARFVASDERQTEVNRKDAKAREPAVYRDTSFLDQVQQQLAALARLPTDYTGMDQITEEAKTRFALDPAGRALQALRQYTAKPPPQPDWPQLTESLMKALAEIPVLSDDEAKVERDPTQRARTVKLHHHTFGERGCSFDRIVSIKDDLGVLRTRIEDIEERLGFPVDLRPSVTAAVMANCKPFYELDKEETQKRREAAYNAEPEVQRTFRVDEVVVPAGRALTRFDLTALAEEQHAYIAQSSATDIWLRRLGAAGLIAVIGLGLWTYIWSYNPRIADNPTRGVALVCLLLACQGLAVAFTSLQPEWVVLTATCPTLLAVIVLAIAYDQRFAMAAGAVLTMLVAFSLDLSVGLTVMLLTGVVVASVQLDQVRTCAKLIWVGLSSGLAMGLAAFMASLLEHPLSAAEQWKAVRFDWLLATCSGPFTGLLVQGILPAIERAFKVTTAMTLKELSDASLPLLRRLAQEAPGTYQHSLRLADLAEAAAESVDANSLLCKVGAMYHDIGKINKPSYFVENQSDGVNRHADILPAMSLLIIIGHVKDGMEMAREYGLPPVLRHFIESHHGTTLVEYFYHAACERARSDRLPPPSEFEYRYPGPKPQTREAAILMLGDSVESACRTLEDPTPSRIAQLVRHLAATRLADGQFNECNLTLRELHKIEESLIKTTTAMYHGRIRYPSNLAPRTLELATEKPRPASAAS